MCAALSDSCQEIAWHSVFIYCLDYRIYFTEMVKLSGKGPKAKFRYDRQYFTISEAAAN